MTPSIALSLENFSRYGGGAEAYAIALAEDFIAQGWQVHLIGLSWDNVPAKAQFHALTLPRFAPAWLKILLFAARHKKIVQQLDVDVVLGFGNTTFMNVYQSHGGVHRYSTQRKLASIRQPIWRLLKQFSILISIKDKTRAWVESAPFRMDPPPRVIAISQMVVNDFTSFYGFPAEKIDLIYNGIDLQRFNPAVRQGLRGPLRQELQITKEQVVFLFLSYTLRKKGIMPLLEATAQLKKVHGDKFKILVVGKRPKGAVRRLVSQLHLKKQVLFFGPTKDPLTFFANSDVFVLPTYYDTCSLVTLEAMACGLPVITTEFNGAAGVIHPGEDGHVLSHPPSAVQLAKYMEDYLDRESLATMAAQAGQTALQYSAAQNHEKVIEVCRQIAASQGDKK